MWVDHREDGETSDCSNKENRKRVEQVKVELSAMSIKNSRWDRKGQFEKKKRKGQFDFLILAHKDMG